MPYSVNLYDAPIVREIAEAMPRLSQLQRKIATYVLDHIFEVATGGIEDLAAASGVSTASVSRFVTNLNYVNFVNFKQALLEAFKSPYAEDAERDGDSGAPTEATDASFEKAHAAITATKRFLGTQRLGDAIDLIVGARRVYCLALGYSTPLANYTSICLSPYCDNIQQVESGGEIGVYRLSHIGEGDLLIIFSFPRYSADIIRFARLASERKAKILAITDQPSSPLVVLSDLALYTPSEHLRVPVSLVGSVALVEALTMALATRFPEKFEAATGMTEDLLPFLYFDYAKPRSKRGKLGKTQEES